MTYEKDEAGLLLNLGGNNSPKLVTQATTSLIFKNLKILILSQWG